MLLAEFITQCLNLELTFQAHQAIGQKPVEAIDVLILVLCLNETIGTMLSLQVSFQLTELILVFNILLLNGFLIEFQYVLAKLVVDWPIIFI